MCLVMARGDGVLDAIDRSVALRSRSLLSVWMRENHDAFRERLKARFPDWKVLTDLFFEAGLTDRYGNKPKPESARKLWQRIKREIEIERSKPRQPVRQDPKPASAPTTIAVSTPANPSASSDVENVLEKMRAKSRKFPDVV